jgi:hypothetical protein
MIHAVWPSYRRPTIAAGDLWARQCARLSTQSVLVDRGSEDTLYPRFLCRGRANNHHRNPLYREGFIAA